MTDVEALIKYHSSKSSVALREMLTRHSGSTWRSVNWSPAALEQLNIMIKEAQLRELIAPEVYPL